MQRFRLIIVAIILVLVLFLGRQAGLAQIQPSAATHIQQQPVDKIDQQIWLDLQTSPDRNVPFVMFVAGTLNNPVDTIANQHSLEMVLSDLQKLGLIEQFESVYGRNVIIATGNVMALRYLAAWPEVSFIEAYQEDQLAKENSRNRAGIQLVEANGGILGIVTEEGSGDPLEGIAITAYYKPPLENWRVEATTTTGADGIYSISGLPGGVYRVRFFDSTGTYATEYYNSLPTFNLATKFDVPSDGTTAGINATMAQAGQISGQVTNQDNNKGVQDINVSARQLVEGSWVPVANGLTDRHGNYTVGSLLPGDYILRYSDPFLRFVNEYYDNQTDPDLADTVTVNAGQTTSGIDAALGPYGWISGRVTDTVSTLPVEDIDILVYEWNDNLGIWQDVSFGNTLADGTYEAYGLETVVYRVDFSDPHGFFQSEIYDDRPYTSDTGRPSDGELTAGTPISVTVGAETPGIDASLLVPTTTVTNTVATGWNLISFPTASETPEVSAALSSITGTYEIIWAFDACDTGWTRYDPDINPTFNTLENVQVEFGHWLELFSPQLLEYAGREPYRTAITLCPGWNLVGYPSLTERPVEEALASIEGKYNVIFQYVAADVGDEWKKYDPNLPFGNTLLVMAPGYGYWIQMNETADWIVTNRVVPVADSK